MKSTCKSQSGDVPFRFLAGTQRTAEQKLAQPGPLAGFAPDQTRLFPGVTLQVQAVLLVQIRAITITAHHRAGICTLTKTSPLNAPSHDRDPLGFQIFGVV